MPQQLNIYRICLEILNNLYKHANYQYLKIIVERTGNNLQFEFTHNGMGITTKEIDKLAAGSQGLGLKSLMSRALLLNATINYEIDEGLASIKLQIPINGGK
jgi:signal transduction histidine kinase